MLGDLLKFLSKNYADKGFKFNLDKTFTVEEAKDIKNYLVQFFMRVNGTKQETTCQKIIDKLGVKPRDIEQTILDTIQSAIDLGILPGKKEWEKDCFPHKRGGSILFMKWMTIHVCVLFMSTLNGKKKYL